MGVLAMQIGTLEIQWQHPPTLVNILQNRGEELHAEFRNTKVHVDSTEVEDGAEPTSALGSQDVMGINNPGHATAGQVPEAPFLRRDTISSHSASHLS